LHTWPPKPKWELQRSELHVSLSISWLINFIYLLSCSNFHSLILIYLFIFLGSYTIQPTTLKNHDFQNFTNLGTDSEASQTIKFGWVQNQPIWLGLWTKIFAATIWGHLECIQPKSLKNHDLQNFINLSTKSQGSQTTKLG